MKKLLFVLIVPVLILGLMTGCGGVDEGTAVPAIIQGAYDSTDVDGIQLIITASQLTVISGNSTEFNGNICFEIEYRFVEVAASGGADPFDYHELTLFRADDRKEIATIRFLFDADDLEIFIPADPAGDGIDNAGTDHPNAIGGGDVITLAFEFMTHMIPGYGAGDSTWDRILIP